MSGVVEAIHCEFLIVLNGSGMSVLMQKVFYPADSATDC